MSAPALDFATTNDLAEGITTRHVLQIDRYWHLKHLHPSGRWVSTTSFSRVMCFLCFFFNFSDQIMRNSLFDNVKVED